ncbi:MAG: DUF4150 domain-containing protein [Desulfobacteraceae bacterium]|jgi:hypothetical protein
MANDVFANGREISCKKADGKSICAFPDVCMTPPENPATPPGVPIPYPNTGMAKDTTNGSKKVKISGKEILLKNKSYFKKSMGDEAGCATKKGVITSVNRGKVYFNAWSMDVKVEGKNVVRHLDLATHNHASFPGSTPPWAYADESYLEDIPECCHKNFKKAQQECQKNGGSPDNCTDSCRKAQACVLTSKGSDKKNCCSPDNTGHHMIEDHWVKGNSNFPAAQKSATPNGYKAAPTVCANRFRSVGTTHRKLHDVQGVFEESYLPDGGRHKENRKSGGFDYGAGKEAALTAHGEVFKSSNCNKDCLEAQLDSFYGSDNRRSLNEPEKQAIGQAREGFVLVQARPKRTIV